MATAELLVKYGQTDITALTRAYCYTFLGKRVKERQASPDMSTA
jgi:hypothetical protein